MTAPGSAAGTDLREQLHRRGLRVTPQRQLVLEAIDRLGHATPDAVCSEVQSVASGVNLSTIYRTLELFEQLGIVRHAHLGTGSPTYHSAAAAAHLHLVCDGCGSVAEADVEVATDLVGRLRASHGFSPDVEHMAISGRCAHCVKASSSSRPVR
ncbi:MAG TPA: Fur family transcriptional regulator [Actinomycetes bacterium]